MLDRILGRFKTILERFLLVWLLLLSAVAYWWTSWFQSPGTFDPFAASAGWLSILIFVTMLAIGSLLPEDEIRQVFRRWPTVFGGTAIQYTVMPLLAYSVGRLLGLQGDLLVGIVMVGCVPGAMASNVLTLIARGNVSYSVSLTTSATILSPIMVPVVMWLTLERVVENFPTGKTCLDLCWMVVLPVVVGHLIARNWSLWRTVAQRVGTIIANLTILWIIAVVVAKNRQQLAHLESSLLVALLTVNIGGYLAGYAGGHLIRLPASMRRALTLEIGMQNAGLGAALASELFPDDPAIALPAAMYTFGCMLTGTILARLWAERC